MKKLKISIIQISILVFMLVASIKSNAATVDFAIENFKIRDNALGYEVDELHIGRMYYLEFKLVNYSSASASTAGIVIVGGTVRSDNPNVAEPYIYEVLDGVTLASKASKTYKYYFTPTIDFMDVGTQFTVGATTGALSSDTDKNINNNTMNTEIPMVNHAYEDFRIQSVTIKDAATNTEVSRTLTNKEYYVEVKIKNNSKTANTLEYVGFLGIDSAMVFWDYVYDTVIQPGSTQTIKYYYTSSSVTATNEDLTTVQVYIPDDCYSSDNESILSLPFRENIDLELVSVDIKGSNGYTVQTTYTGESYYIDAKVKNHSDEEVNLEWITFVCSDSNVLVFDYVENTVIQPGETKSIKYNFTCSNATTSDTDVTYVYAYIPEDGNASNNEAEFMVPFKEQVDFDIVNAVIRSAETDEIVTTLPPREGFYLEITVKNNSKGNVASSTLGDITIYDSLGDFAYLTSGDFPNNGVVSKGGTMTIRYDYPYTINEEKDISFYAILGGCGILDDENDATLYLSISDNNTDFGISNVKFISVATGEELSQLYNNSSQGFYIEVEVTNECSCSEAHMHPGVVFTFGKGDNIIEGSYTSLEVSANGSKKQRYYVPNTFNMPTESVGFVATFPNGYSDSNSNNDMISLSIPVAQTVIDFDIASASIKSAETDEIVTSLPIRENFYIEVSVKNNSVSEFDSNTLENVSIFSDDGDWFLLDSVDFPSNGVIPKGGTATIKLDYPYTINQSMDISFGIYLAGTGAGNDDEDFVELLLSITDCTRDLKIINAVVKDANTHEISKHGHKHGDYYLEIEYGSVCECGKDHYFPGLMIALVENDLFPSVIDLTDPTYIPSGESAIEKYYFNMSNIPYAFDEADVTFYLTIREDDVDTSNNSFEAYWSFSLEYIDFGIVSAVVRSAATDEIVTQTYTGEDYYIDFEIENNSDTEETLEHIGFLGSDSDLIFWDYLENITIKNGENYIGKYYFTSSKTAGSNDNLMGIYLYLPDDNYAQNNEFTIALPFGTRYSDFSVDDITVKDSRSGNVVDTLYSGRDYYFEVTITNHSNDSSNNIVPSLYIMAGFEDDEHSSPDSIIYTTDEYIVESGTTETFTFDFKAITSYPIIPSSRLDITALINTGGVTKEDQNVDNNEMTIEIPLLGIPGIELTYSLSTSNDTNSPVVITYQPSSTSGPIKGVKLPDGSTVNKSSGIYTVSENGTYIFVAFDEFGYTYEMEVVIDTIDYGKPIITLERDPDGEWVNQDVTVTLEYSDT